MTTKIDNISLRLDPASQKDVAEYGKKFAAVEKTVEGLLISLKQIDKVTKALKSREINLLPKGRDSYIKGQSALNAQKVRDIAHAGTSQAKEIANLTQIEKLTKQAAAAERVREKLTLANSRAISNSLPRIQKITNLERLKLEIGVAQFRQSKALADNDKRRLRTAKSMETKLREQVKSVQMEMETTKRLNREREKALALSKKQAAAAARAAAAPTMAQRADLHRKASVQRVLGDGGASLMRIQAGLLVNYAALNVLKRSISSTVSFSTKLDEALKNLQAIVVVSDNAMVGLKESIIGVSEATKFTAIEVAQAAVTLGQAGFSVDQIKASLGAISLLATATGTDLNKAVDIATSTIGVFNMTASDMGHVANVMTEAVNSSKLSIEKLTLGLQYSGNIAAQSGVRFDELTAALGAMANAGIRSGSTLGTGSRQLFIALEKPSQRYLSILKNLGLTTYDVSLRTKSLSQVLRTLKEAGFSSSDAIHSFAVRAAAAYNALSGNLDQMDALQKSFRLTKAAVAANAKQMNSLSNQSKRLGSILGSVGATGFEPLLLASRNTIRSLADFFGLVRKHEGLLRGVTVSLAAVASGFVTLKAIRFATGVLKAFNFTLPITSVELKAVATSFRVAKVSSGTLAASFTALKFAAATILPGIGSILASVGAAWWTASSSISAYTSEQNLLNDAIDKQKAKLETSNGAVKDYAAKVGVVNKKISELINRSETLKSKQVYLQQAIQDVRAQFSDMGYEVDNTTSTLGGLIDKLQSLRGELLKKYTVSIGVEVTNLEVLKTLQKIRGDQSLRSIGKLDTSKLSKEQKVLLTKLSQAKTPQQVSEINQLVSKQLKASSDASGLPVNQQQVTSPFRKKSLFSMLGAVAPVGGGAGPVMVDQNMLRRTRGQQQAKILTSALGKAQVFTDSRANMDNLSNKQKIASISKQTAKEQGTTRFKILNTEASSLQRDIDTSLRALERAHKNDPVGMYTAYAGFAKTKRLSLEVAKSHLKSPTYGKPLTPENQRLLRTKDNAALAQLSKAGDRLFKDAKKVNTTNLGLKTRTVSRKLYTQLSDLRNSKTKKDAKAARDAAEASAKQNFELKMQTLKAQRKIGVPATISDQMRVKTLKYDYGVTTDRIKFTYQRKMDSLKKVGGDGGVGIAKTHDFHNMMNKYKSQGAVVKDNLTSGKISPRDAVTQMGGTVSSAEKELAARKKILDVLQRQAAAGALSTQDQKKMTRLVGEEKTLTSFIASERKKISEIQAKNGLLGFDLNAEIKKFSDASLNVNTVLSTGLSGALTNITDGFTNLFSVLVTEPLRAGQAFKQFEVSVLKSLEQVISKLLVTYTLQKALGALFPGAGITQSMGISDMFGSILHIKKAAGGEVKGSLPRDSVPHLLMPGEYVLRASAAQAIGRKTLDRINAMGNTRMASGGYVGALKPKGLGHQTNVYVVSPHQQPVPGPSDIVAVISDDMARGGATRRLVKSIVSGAL